MNSPKNWLGDDNVFQQGLLRFQRVLAKVLAVAMVVVHLLRHRVTPIQAGSMLSIPPRTRLPARWRCLVRCTMYW